MVADLVQLACALIAAGSTVAAALIARSKRSTDGPSTNPPEDPTPKS